MENSLHKIAIFFDAENVPASKVPEIISSLSKEGDILIQRAYADWSIQATEKWQNQIEKTPITAIQQFHHNQKQAIDKVVMMDAIELAIKHEDIDIFVLVASDNGYYSLGLRLRELGKRVIGIGEKEKCNSIWVNSCNEFIYFEDLEEVDEDILLQEKDKESNELKGFSLEKFLEKAFDSTHSYKDTNSVLLSQMWESVLRLKPDFKVKNYGKKSPKEFIMSFEDKFKISDDGKAQKTFFVEKIETTNSKPRKQGTIKRRIGGYFIISSDDKSGDYFFYKNEINPQFKEAKLEKGIKVDFQAEKEPDPSAEDSKGKNGRATDLKVIG